MAVGEVEQAMAKIADLGAMPLWPSVKPTHDIIIPLQTARKSEILASPAREFSYGPLARQKLDVYVPNNLANGTKLPVLVFLYGGAMIRGEKRRSELFHANVGEFFNNKGFVVVIPDYRLIGTEVDPASFPSGPEDISLALQWVAEGHIPEADPMRLSIMGNSAGGTHLSNFLWGDLDTDLDFKRHHQIPGLHLCAVVIVSSPGYWSDEVLESDVSIPRNSYYGGIEAVKRNSVLSSRQRSDDSTPYMIVWDEYDPLDIRVTIDHFVKEAKEGKLRGPMPSLYEAKGHNHCSPIYALGLGDQADQWGRDVSDWICHLVDGSTIQRVPDP